MQEHTHAHVRSSDERKTAHTKHTLHNGQKEQCLFMCDRKISSVNYTLQKNCARNIAEEKTMHARARRKEKSKKKSKKKMAPKIKACRVAYSVPAIPLCAR